MRAPHGPSWRAIQSLLGPRDVLTLHKGLLLAFEGDRATAALFEALAFWEGLGADPDGWIYKTYAQWWEELVLSRYQIARAASKLIGMGLLERTRRHCPKGTNTYHYRLRPEESL